METSDSLVILSFEEYANLPPIQRSYQLNHSERKLAMDLLLQEFQDMHLEHITFDTDSGRIAVLAHVAVHPDIEEVVQDINSQENLRKYGPFKWPEHVPQYLPELEESQHAEHYFFATHVDVKQLAEWIQSHYVGDQPYSLKATRSANALHMTADAAEDLTVLHQLCTYLDDPKWYAQNGH